MESSLGINYHINSSSLSSCERVLFLRYAVIKEARGGLERNEMKRGTCRDHLGVIHLDQKLHHTGRHASAPEWHDDPAVNVVYTFTYHIKHARKHDLMESWPKIHAFTWKILVLVLDTIPNIIIEKEKVLYRLRSVIPIMFNDMNWLNCYLDISMWG